jgi:predicted RNA-binding Zn ribbon-like protein
MMNTIWADTTGVHDDLTTPAALRDWLALINDEDVEALDDPGLDELAEARGLRDSLRRLAAFSTDDPRPAAESPVNTVEEAVAAVNEAAAHRPHAQLAVRDGQLQRGRPPNASPTRTALAELAHDAIELLTGPAAVKLRACQAPGCVLYFVKTHHRREWCSEACGNRARAARHYQRIRDERR